MQGWFQWQRLNYDELVDSYFISSKALFLFRVLMFAYALFVCIYTVIYQDFTRHAIASYDDCGPLIDPLQRAVLHVLELCGADTLLLGLIGMDLSIDRMTRQLISSPCSWRAFSPLWRCGTGSGMTD